jgi:capsid protein
MDLVPDPGLMGVNLKGVIQGVQIDDRGRSLAYVVNKRTVWGGFEPEALVAAENVIQHGFFDRFDQIRGISPIAAAVNSFQDIYENFDYALAKSKVAQLFGLVFYRDAVDSVGVPSPIMDPMDGDGNEGSVRGQEQYKVDFGRGPFSLDLDPGDKAEFLENKTPSTEFKEFTQAMIAVSLKSLDIPFSFYDEAYTNFFGSRSALQLYLKSARSKQNDLRHVLRMLTEWKLTQWVARGRLQLPAGSTVLQVPFNWVADGVPWWNPQVEITAELSAIAGGLQDFAEVRKEHFGDDWFDMIDRRAEQFAYARAKGFPISIPIALGPVEEEQPAEAVSNAR